MILGHQIPPLSIIEIYLQKRSGRTRKLLCETVGDSAKENCHSFIKYQDQDTAFIVQVSIAQYVSDTRRDVGV